MDILERLFLLGHLGLVWLRSCARASTRAVTRVGARWFPWLVAPPPEPRWEIITALAFARDGRFKEITHGFTPKTWQDDIPELTGWSGDQLQRVEVRYAFISALGKRSKYRMVLRHGDTCPALPPPRPCSTHPQILNATLDPHGEGSPVDVTNRLRKYAGPSKDFHAAAGLRVHCADILPVDDWDYVSERFRRLVVLDIYFKTHSFDLRDSDTQINLANN